MNPLTATSTELRSGVPEAAAVRPPVSVIVPAFNAAATLEETLESLQAQTHSDWETIVVDDGSTDETAAIASEAAVRDSRIRVLTVPHGGVSRARNAGIAAARHEWLLFLDADDWLLPQALELLTDEVRRDSAVELVHGGWTYVTPDGEEVPDRYQAGTPEQLFLTAGRTCAFAIHACLVRKGPVLKVGSFDPTFVTCEDWDLWQRLARAGVASRAVENCVARCRVRMGSASFDAAQVLTDGLRVIETGHADDPRVPSPYPEFARGIDAVRLGSTKLTLLAWASGLAFAQGKNALPLLESARLQVEPGLDPRPFAASLVKGGSLPFRRIPAWERVWSHERARVKALLQAIEERTGAPGFARAAERALEYETLSRSTDTWPRTLGATRAEVLDISIPLPDVELPDDVELLLLRVEAQGNDLGVLELPVCDRRVSAAIIADAVAAEFGWTILRHFFAASVFPHLRLEETPEGLTVWRGALQFARSIRPGEDGAGLEQALHGAVGWGLFLQELWGRPEWPNRRFYGPAAEPETMAPVRQVDGNRVVVEVSDEIPDLLAQSPWLEVAVTVGGAGAGLIHMPSKDGRIPAHALRRAITAELGYELCVVAIREALVGRGHDGGGDLRSRLQQRASSPRTEARASAILPDGVTGRSPILDHAIRPGAPTLVLGRRPGAFGTSACRRASLPAPAAKELLTAARIAGDAVVVVGDGEDPTTAWYAPELLSPVLPPHAAGVPRSVTPGGSEDSGGDRHAFELLFAGGADPWRYTSPYEQVKYEQTLSLLPHESLDVVLELACAEGHFTHQLAPRVGRVVAADISAVALARAAARCADRPNVEFRRLDLFRDPLPSPVDLIVCSEVLYYARDREALARVTRSFADAVREGGHLLMTHAHVLVDDPTSTGFNWAVPFGARFLAEFIPAHAPFRPVRELHTDLYRVQLFRKEGLAGSRPENFSSERAEHGLLPHAVAEQVRWGGGRPVNLKPRVGTSRLPILAYHRVSPTGDRVPGLRVAPQMFDEQLHYLADSGFRCVSLDDWRRAAAAKSPIPGRAVVLTFDDGYVDFAEYAWPLLQKHGFTASLFVVTDLVGDRSRWDSTLGEEAPLLDWPELRRLQCEGVEIGSHSATHRPLVGLSNADVVREAVSSRASLIQELGTPVHAFAYPFGLTSKVVQHLVGACGFAYGLTSVDRCVRYQDPLLALPRRAVSGSATLSSFIKRLPG